MLYCLVTVSASGGKTLISRINLIRPPPAAPYGLAPLWHLWPVSVSADADAETAPNTTGQEWLTYARRLLPTVTTITRPEETTGAICINNETEVLTGLPSRYL